MAELIPAAESAANPPPASGSLLAPFTDPQGGNTLTRVKTFTGQPPVKKMLPWFAGLAGLGLAAVAWATLSPAPQRVLYSELDDGEKAKVVTALDKAAIHYTINNQTGALSVNEDDLYRARMLVASDGALATPDDQGSELDKLPLGASRTLEGEKLRAQHEHNLVLSIMEIDGVEAARVHLADPQKSVFVRDNIAPTASVMVRLARGRQLSDSQVAAIVNLVAGSVPGLSADAVRVVDQHGRLLTDKASGSSERLELQGRMEDKLRTQLDALLTPMVGEGNFSSEVQVDLDMDQVTSARESYDKDGAVRSETQASSQSTNPAPIGVPGVLSNTPPPQTVAVPNAAPGAGPTPSPVSTNGETSQSKTYEVGRDVQVSNGMPGKIKRLSVAVALSQEAMKRYSQKDVDQIKQLVSATVGADPARGDQIAVMVRAFDAKPIAAPAIYQQPWFLTYARYGVAVVVVVLVLVFGVRPLVKALKPVPPKMTDEEIKAAAAQLAIAQAGADGEAGEGAENRPEPIEINAEYLGQQVSQAQRLVTDKPDEALMAIRELLSGPPRTEAA